MKAKRKTITPFHRQVAEFCRAVRERRWRRNHRQAEKELALRRRRAVAVKEGS